MNINVKSLFFMTQKFTNLLKSNATAEDPARVINIASIDGMGISASETYSYSSSKAAVIHLTRHLSRKLVSDKINVNAFAPGPYPSQMLGLS